MVACKAPNNTPEPSSPNIILVMCDDLGWGDTGFNGNSRVQTPNLDRLASMGMKFNRFYSASAVCSPTRASCLTGRNPYRMEIPTANSGHMKDGEITLPEILKDQGYATGHFGKWHLGTLTTKVRDANRGRPGDSSHYSIPTMNGYDEYFVSESKVPTYDPMIKPLVFDTARGEGLRYGWAAVEDKNQAQAYGTYYWVGEEKSETQNLEGDNTGLIMDRAISFIEKATKQNQPFLTVIWIHTPHLPVVADRSHREMYADLSHEEQIYYGTITNMDEEVGRLWKTLETLEVSNNTMLWFASDNGPEDRTPGSSGPFRERKRSLHEGGIRVPAFCVWPEQINNAQETNTPAITSDYLPTILDMLDITYPDNRPLDGISLKEVINGSQEKRDSPIGFWFRQKRSWVTDQYKLISKDNGETFELYDLLADKEEQQNIIENHSELAENMKGELAEWIASCERSGKGLDYPKTQ